MRAERGLPPAPPSEASQEAGLRWQGGLELSHRVRKGAGKKEGENKPSGLPDDLESHRCTRPAPRTGARPGQGGPS